MEDYEITDQVLEAEGVIRDLAGHMQHAMNVAAAADEAKQSYEGSLAALQRANEELAAAGTSVHGATEALASVANDSFQKFRDISRTVRDTVDQFGGIRDSINAEIQKAAQNNSAAHSALSKNLSGAHSALSKDLSGVNAELTAMKMRVDALESTLVDVQNSITASFQSVQTALMGEVEKSATQSMARFDALAKQSKRIMIVAMATFGIVAALVIVRLLLH